MRGLGHCNETPSLLQRSRVIRIASIINRDGFDRGGGCSCVSSLLSFNLSICYPRLPLCSPLSPSCSCSVSHRVQYIRFFLFFFRIFTSFFFCFLLVVGLLFRLWLLRLVIIYSRCGNSTTTHTHTHTHSETHTHTWRNTHAICHLQPFLDALFSSLYLWTVTVHGTITPIDCR